MLGLVELAALNDTFAQRQAEANKPKNFDLKTPITPRGNLIVVITQPGKERVYYDRYEHFVHDRTKVNGWDSWELDQAKCRAEQLQGVVHSDAKVAVDQR